MRRARRTAAEMVLPAMMAVLEACLEEDTGGLVVDDVVAVEVDEMVSPDTELDSPDLLEVALVSALSWLVVEVGGIDEIDASGVTNGAHSLGMSAREFPS